MATGVPQLNGFLPYKRDADPHWQFTSALVLIGPQPKHLPLQCTGEEVHIGAAQDPSLTLTLLSVPPMSWQPQYHLYAWGLCSTSSFVYLLMVFLMEGCR